MSNEFAMGARRFGRVNWLGLRTLISREVQRFVAVWSQTMLAPLVTAGIFILIFSIAIGPTRGDVMGVSFVAFLTPGILMMTVIQNAFANTSSSIMIAKSQGNIVDTLMPPLSPGELVAGYLAGSVVRGVLVATLLAAAAAIMVVGPPAHPLWLLVFVVVGSTFLGALGIVAAIHATKFDQMAAITNFIITPLSFLSGTFYSLEAMPPILAAISHVNPIFYLIDGARYGMIGQSDSSPWLGLAIGLVSCALVISLAWYWFRTGYKLKS